MEYAYFKHVFYGSLRQNLHHEHVYFRMPPESRWIYLKGTKYIGIITYTLIDIPYIILKI